MDDRAIPPAVHGKAFSEVEVEFKADLETDPAGILSTPHLLGPPDRSVTQRSTYYEAGDKVLADAGFTLRVREADGRFVQTVKASGAAAGLFVRPEWEIELDGPEPRIDETSPVAQLVTEAGTPLTARFDVSVERRVWTIREGDSAIEVAADAGEVVAGERRSDVCELEFEQIGGAPSDLFALVRRIADAMPLRIGVLSKAERGRRLMAGVKPYEKASAPPATPSASAQHAFELVVAVCLRHYRLNEATLLRQRDATALHQARVALRRLRSALSIHRPFLDARALRFNDELRWLAGVLGQARDVDVMIARADGVLADPLAQARDQAYAEVEAALTGERVPALMLDLVEWLAIGAWRDDPASRDMREHSARDFASAALDRLRRKVRRRGRHLDRLTDEERHELRKAAKRLRYAAEFFAPLYPRKRSRKRGERFLDRMEELQDALGGLNDLAATPALLEQLGLAAAPEAEALLGSGSRQALLDEAVDAYAGLIDVKRFWRDRSA